MQLDLDPQGLHNIIRAFSQTSIKINDKEFNASLIVTADKIISPWHPTTLQDLKPEHWDPFFELQLDLILLGTGKYLRFPAPEVTQPIIERQIGLEIMNTAAACRTYNIVVSDGRRVAAAIIFDQS